MWDLPPRYWERTLTAGDWMEINALTDGENGGDNQNGDREINK